MSNLSPEEQKTMTRRQLLQSAGALATTIALSSLYGCAGGASNTNLTSVSSSGSSNSASSAQASPSPSPSASPSPVVETFPQMPVRASANGVLDTTLNVNMAQNVVNGTTITTRTYENMIGGPTMKMKPGDTFKLLMKNNLPANPDQNTTYPDHNTPHRENSTNNHVHGLHVSPSNNSDNIFVEILPGDSFQYQYNLPSDHPPGTYWMHPHKHGSSAQQMLGGMGMALIIEGGLDNVPEIKAARDIVFLINELNIDPSTEQVPAFLPPFPNPVQDNFVIENRTILVNGQSTPTLKCRPGEVVRLRMVCATVITFMAFTVDSHTLHLAAWDGNTLSSLQSTDKAVEMAPGNRVEILLKAGSPGTYAFRKTANSISYDKDPELVFAYLKVEGDPLDMALPTTLPAPFTDIKTSELTGKRTLVFTIGLNGPDGPPDKPIPHYLDFAIDGKRFDADVINQSVNLNAVEEWTLVNASPSGHPFHIHINPFQVMSINGSPLPKPEWRDVIMIPPASNSGPGTVVIRSRFLDFTGLYVLHCHILVHEDLGMMQTVNVI